MRLRVSLITLLLALTASAYQKPFGELKEEQKFKDYTVRIYRNEQTPPDNDHNPDHQDGLGCFEILRSGKQVYFQTGVIFKVGSNVGDDELNKKPVKMGQSIMGDKQPDLVISEMNGGNNSWCDYYIFSISDTFKLITKIKDTGGGEFKDLRGRGALDLITRDVLTFEYWNCSGAESPSPTVILRYLNGKYRLDLEKMKRPAPTKAELKKMAEDFKAKFAEIRKEMFIDKKWSAPSEMWGEMLDLIYSGNQDSAWRLCDLSWPADHLGEAIFLEEFKKQLQTSQYYKDINQASFQSRSVHNKALLECFPHIVKLVGTIKNETFPGPPNYRDSKKGDEREDYWILKLAEPIDVAKDPEFPAPNENSLQLNVRDLQLNLDVHNLGYQRYREFLGKRVEVMGELSQGFTVHHKTAVMIWAREIKLAE